MNHSFLEPGMFRAWRDGWHYEIAWGGSFRWFGLKFEASSDGGRGRTLSAGLWWLSVYLVLERGAEVERAAGIWFDDNHLSAQWYRGDDELNSMPWMFEWPWKRWIHVRRDTIGAKRKYPYRYELVSGEVQNVTATVQREEIEWRWMFKRNPFRICVKQYLDIEFSEEVGEKRGTWKGGVLGCGFDVSPREDDVSALRRMERESRFN